MMDSQEILLEIYQESRLRLEKEEYVTQNFKEISYGIQFSVLKKGGAIGIVRIFRNNKGIVKYDYSQINDESKKQQIKWILEGETSTVSINDSISSEQGSNIEYPNIGTDESGKGDYFGPLVTASVWVNKEIKNVLDRSGIRDSKKISDSRIIELAQIIKKSCNGKFVVIEIPPVTYNNLYTQFKNEGKNLNVLLAWSHAKAIEELLEKVDSKIAISDQFADEKFIINKLQDKGKNIQLIQEHKAERYTSVAAASILARERFLEKLKKISIEYSIDFSKGASSLVVDQAREFVGKYGQEQLTNVAKLHFKTTEQVI
ncbi:ribonuclease HIII [Reichenbachiella agariperforans]|uniref:Ribonuclease n=1 Tax=Reichenbachiella agariperforans TaxID=156994 RepID=A0A1M6J3J9_REIAG|nr:ribonuclease HIII [Reichenbachiella agariperforans]SHJ41121.1 ribonuclease HIII [Reichenbachiella agariperforans]